LKHSPILIAVLLMIIWVIAKLMLAATSPCSSYALDRGDYSGDHLG
jgi:hypothetical protein